MSPAIYASDDSNERKKDTQTQNSQSGQQSQGNQETQRPSQHDDGDNDETEYRGSEHGVLGVMLSEQNGRGVRIRDILPGSPAEQAGLRIGDQFTKLDNRTMGSYRDVIRAVNRIQPGKNANITVQRSDKEVAIQVKLAAPDQLYGNDGQRSAWNRRQQRGELNDRDSTVGRSYRRDRMDDQYDNGRSSNDRYRDQSSTTSGSQRGRQGYSEQGSDQFQSNDRGDQRIAGREGSRQRWSYRGQQQSDDRGVLGIDFENQRGAAIVREIWNGSPAQQAGLRRGDEIVAMNGQEMQDADDVLDELRDRQPGERVSLTVSRNGQERTLRARLASEQELDQQRSRNRTNNSQAVDRGQYQDRNRLQRQTGNGQAGDDGSNEDTNRR